ncbi:AAA family ATPase [Nocardia sp. NBC_01503]|uniref:nucleotide-binding protein n=1 Tax=Nocardia sp. NBC_01503 TaxID=2975997 RepID=UPI002E7AF355|nr:AAA family ATPase [Nocardia sp. NBC_01503]WTL34513.1 AAA family ATPase [Nocardia sp. NBC_01503]
MTTNDQNSTSQAAAGLPVDADDIKDERPSSGEGAPESDQAAEANGEGEQGAGFFPPVPDSIEQTTVFQPEGAGPYGQGPDPFAPGGFPPAGPYGAPPQGGPNGPFDGQGPFPGAPFQNGQQGFPPPGNYPAPDSGQFAPPPNPGAPGAFPGQDGPYGEVRDETPYGEIRQEIGSDGMVRRVFPDQPGQPGPQEPGGAPGQFGQPGQFAPANDQPGGPIYSWSPPPAQPPQQPMQQPGFAPQGWNGQPPQGFPQQQGGFQQQPPPGHSVNDLNLLRRARRAPRSGWRRAVHKASGGVINPGESPADLMHAQLVDRVNQPVRGDYRIAILSLKGGVGKTTTTVGLGSTFASERGDRVIAIDANPDLGTLAHRVPRQTRSTVRNLLEDSHITRYSDVRAHTSQAPSRLEVLASEQDPAVSEAFSEADYRKAIGILQQFYNIILTDCGTGLMHSAMSGVLDMASSLVLVTSPAIDGARSASATLDWLDHHGYHKLVERTVVVVNASRKGSSTVDLDQLRKLFLDRTRAVQVVPFDDHLAEGAEIDLELVSKPTRRALLELAAMVADDFGYHAAQQGFQPRQH